MKLFHLSDLHLGKRLFGISLIDDQRDILEKIIGHIVREKPGAVIIAGDVYDRSVPPEDAVALFDDFLFELSRINVPVLIISGNHDSAERLAYGGRILNRSGIYISPEFNKYNYDAVLKPVTLSDEYGEIDFYMLPFFTPYAVKIARGDRADADISTYTNALRTVIGEMNADRSRRNVLIAHLSVSGALTCDSESFSAGGLENVDAAAFEPFDYTALGHFHSPQKIGGNNVRYCGTPLKYSFSEADHKKSITVVDMLEKGNVDISLIALDKPLHDLREIKGAFAELAAGDPSDDYIKAVLTDEYEIPNAMNRLREYFPNIMQTGYENSRTGITEHQGGHESSAKLSPTELFRDFYKAQTGLCLNERQAKIVGEIFEEITEGKS